MKRSAVPFLFVVSVLCLVCAPDALAQAVQDQTQQRFTGILNAFALQSSRWQSVLYSAAQFLFFSLATITVVWTNAALALRGGDVRDFVEANTKWILSTGLMWMWLIHGYEWSLSIVVSFRQAGEKAIAAGAPGIEAAMDPAAILQNGMVVVGAIVSTMTSWSTALTQMPLFLSGFALLIGFAFIAGYVAVSIAESYLVIGGSALLLGFGASPWTKDIAVRTIMYAVSVGAKLFVMQLIVGVTMGSIMDWVQTFPSADAVSALSLVGLTILIVIMIKSIPQLVQGLISGAATSSQGNMITVATALTAAAASGGAAAAASGVFGGKAASAAAASAGITPSAAGGLTGADQMRAVGAHAMRGLGHVIGMSAGGFNPGHALGPLGAIARGAQQAPGEKPALNVPGFAVAGSATTSAPLAASEHGESGLIRGAGSAEESAGHAATLGAASVPGAATAGQPAAPSDPGAAAPPPAASAQSHSGPGIASAAGPVDASAKSSVAASDSSAVFTRNLVKGAALGSLIAGVPGAVVGTLAAAGLAGGDGKGAARASAALAAAKAKFGRVRGIDSTPPANQD